MEQRAVHGVTPVWRGLASLVIVAILFGPAVPGRAAAAGDEEWTTECVDCPRAFEITAQALQLDAAGQPHLAYGSDHLYYAWREGRIWHHEVVDETPFTGQYASLALGGDGEAHVTYWDNTNNLLYARREATGWQIEVVASPAIPQQPSSLALDGQGRPHVAYLAYVADVGMELRYGYRDALGWHFQLVEQMNSGATPSLAVDGPGRAHIAYESDNVLKYAEQEDSGWRIEVVPEAVVPLHTPSLALDAAGRPHLAYGGGPWGGEDPEVRYAYRDPLGWHVETVAAVGSADAYPSLALDGAGQAHLTYYDGSGRTLDYAARDGSGWHFEVLANMPYARPASLVLDGEGRPHIGHMSVSFMDLYHTYRDAAGWHSEPVDHGYLLGTKSALALDHEGRPHVVYGDGDTQALRHMFRDGSGWHGETADEIATRGLPFSLVLDGEGRPHTTFLYVDSQDVSQRTVTYAYQDPSGWHAEAVAVGPLMDVDTSLALDPAGRPHVAFLDGESGLLHAYRDAAGWHIETVPGTAIATYGPSLAVDSLGFAHIAYRSGDGLTLRYAYQDAAGWHLETVEGTDVASMNVSLALDAGDRPHVGYTVDECSPCVSLARYAYRDLAGWHNEAIPAAPEVSLDLSLAVTPDGLVGMTYRGADHLLYYLYRDASGWHVETVAGAGEINYDVALALDGRGDPHILYTMPDRDLKYARGHLHADLSASTKAGQPGVGAGGRLAYTLSLANAGREPAAFVLTDPLPALTTYVPGSLSAAGGSVEAGQGITWTGTISGFGHLTATFAVTVADTLTAATTMVNVATLSGDPLGPLSLEARNLVNGATLYLPLVYKGEPVP